MDMDDAKEAFIAECSDLLEEMELALLNLESDPEDEGLINSIFRSAHTIKGTSGLFGYDDIVSFTHVVETFLDKIRDKSVAIDASIIALLLSCQDHMKILVDLAVAEEPLSDENKQHDAELTQSLQERGGLAATSSGGADENSENVSADELKHESGDESSSDCWHISIRFNDSVLVNGMDPLSFIRYLSRLGEVVSVSAVTDALPEVKQFDPERCYLGFEIRLKSDTNKQEIESAFEFVIDDCQLNILPPNAKLSHYAEVMRNLPEEDMRLGEILVACGALTQRELEQALNDQKSQDSQSSPSGKRIGEVLLENHDVHPKTLETAVAKQQVVTEKKLVSSRSIRVDATKLGEQINLVGELVIAGARAQLLAKQTGNEDLIESISSMERLVEQIRDSALRLRMVQIGDTFKRFQRTVRDVSSELNKDIHLVINGEETELDKTLVEKIGDPLMHLVRNSMDHGLETAEERTDANKPPQGVLELNAYHDSGSIVIEVTDDGRGLSREKILNKAIEKGLLTDGDQLSDNEVYQLIFEPGFSTAESVTNLSGRGVGMDVVKKNIQALRGSVELTSEAGKGSTVTIRLPLTLAIIEGFLVEVADASYVIPLGSVVECIELTQQHYDELMDHQFINLRGDLLPYIRLRDTFGGVAERKGRENIVVVQYGDTRAGLVVDDLMGEFQTVIKPMGKVFEHLRGVSGATILGSGEVAVILDVAALISRVKASVDRNASTGMVA